MDINPNIIPLNVTANGCPECGDITYHIPLTGADYTYHPAEGLVVHLDDDEMTRLYFELKEFKTGLKQPRMTPHSSECV